MPWFKRFYDPILPDGRELHTLRDAAHYITELPKPEHAPRRMATREGNLMLAADNDAPEMLARIAVTQARTERARESRGYEERPGASGDAEASVPPPNLRQSS